jgi:uncharacterized phage protein (TIGR01671 family)
MKREILFRGKRIDNGEWIDGSLLVLNNPCNNYKIFPQNSLSIHDSLTVDPITVSQFTGLIDKNGKKIFEGDILSFSDSYVPHFAKVIFETDEIGSCGCCYSAFQGSGFVGEILPGSDYSYSCFSEDLRESEIIGNVFDNPELVANHD